MKKLKLWYYRNFKVISNEKAKELGLLFSGNIYGDSINRYGCRSIWFDYRNRAYRVEGLVETKLQRAFPKQDIEKQNKTAIEWLVENLDSNIMWTYKAKHILNQAKEMEKQQIINSFYQGQNQDISLNVFAFGEDYYNETFNNK